MNGSWVKLSELMDVRAIDAELTGSGADDVITTLVGRMVAAGMLTAADDALARLLEREQLKSTGIGDGIAIPHAKTDAVSRTWIALGRSRDGVPFGSVDGKPATVVFLILGPPDSSAEHIKVLSRIARLVRKAEFRAAVAGAADADALLETVVQHQE